VLLVIHPFQWRHCIEYSLRELPMNLESLKPRCSYLASVRCSTPGACDLTTDNLGKCEVMISIRSARELCEE